MNENLHKAINSDYGTLKLSPIYVKPPRTGPYKYERKKVEKNIYRMQRLYADDLTPVTTGHYYYCARIMIKGKYLQKTFLTIEAAREYLQKVKQQ